MSAAEEAFALHLRAHGIKHEREYRFHPKRRWRSDFFIAPDVLCEVEGITYFGKNRDGSMRLGRHQTASGYRKDVEKYNAAAMLGFRVFRFTPDMVEKGEAIQTVVEAIGA